MVAVPFSSPSLCPRRPSLVKPHRFSIAAAAAAAMSDDPIREWILTEGKATQITRTSSIGGGCINHARRYDTDAGSFFVKSNRNIGPSMFEGEALGLSAMYATKSIRVPRPFKVGPLPTGGSFIIMEFIEFGGSRGDQAVLGRRLAEMHKAAKSDKGFGFDVDNTIGSTPQINTWSSDWIDFFAEHRLGYQLKLALQQFGDSEMHGKGERLIKNMQQFFDGAVLKPCLLHGDLWSGNISSDKNGDPVILDPACYYGHNEAEFGMSWCAGFGGSFYNSYFEGILEQRRRRAVISPRPEPISQSQAAPQPKNRPPGRSFQFPQSQFSVTGDAKTTRVREKERPLHAVSLLEPLQSVWLWISIVSNVDY